MLSSNIFLAKKTAEKHAIWYQWSQNDLNRNNATFSVARQRYQVHKLVLSNCIHLHLHLQGNGYKEAMPVRTHI